MHPSIVHMILSILIVGTVSYIFGPLCNSEGWDFIYRWDDLENFQWNDMLTTQRPVAETIRQMFTQVRINVVEPTSWMIKACIVHYSGGLNSHHLRIAACIAHVIAAAVLYVTLIRVMKANTSMSSLELQMGSMLAALWFCIHPLNMEVIGWPSAQSYTAAMLFSTLALYCHAQVC